MLRIKKDDKVMVIAGRDKGKVGRVLRVLPSANRVVVENINVYKKAVRRTQQNQQGGFTNVEVALHISNVMLVDKKNNKRTRFAAKVLKDGQKVRISRATGEAI